MNAPLLEAHEVRITIDDVVAVERLSLVTSGDRVVLAGDPHALLSVILGVPSAAAGTERAGGSLADDDPGPLGEAHVVAGTLLLAGHRVATCSHVAITGAASLDPPLPPSWTAEQYVAWGARLAGATAKEAGGLAAVALGRVGLARARRKTTGALSLPERRALVLAQAIAAGPQVLVADAPLRGLEGAGAAFVQQAFAAAADGRRVLVSVGRLDASTAEGALVRWASYVAVIAGGEVVLEAAPEELFAGARVYAISVRTNAEALRAELATRDIHLRGGPVRFSAMLPAGVGPRAILVAAQAVRAAVVEMVPVIG
jgi:ABC-2 type transport system ATP-binding protein